MDYQTRVKMVADMWRLRFSETLLTKAEHEEFRKECADFSVDTIDVIEAFQND